MHSKGYGDIQSPYPIILDVERSRIMRIYSTAFRKVMATLITAVILFSSCLTLDKNVVYADYNQGIVTFVTSLYSDCLGRTPDSAGLDDWCSKLASGQISGKQAAYGFFFSPEFQTNANSMTDDELIDAYYKVFLNRAADPSGKTYWAGQIAGTTNDISILFTGFADSAEFADKCASYGITAGPHINVPTTVRTSVGEAANPSLQSAAESAFATLQAEAARHNWTIVETRVIRDTSTQYGIYYRMEAPVPPTWSDGVIKAEIRGGSVQVFSSQVNLLVWGNQRTYNYDDFTSETPWDDCSDWWWG